MTSFINLPGLGGSGEAHWQTLWEASDNRFSRFEPASWSEPELTDWIDALDRATGQQSGPIILVGHSLAGLLVGHWAADRAGTVAGAFLVATPDPEDAGFPVQAASFKNVPGQALPFPALMIASSDDPYCSLDNARARAAAWGCPCIDVGSHGHINSASGLGAWQQGKELLTAFAAGAAKSV